MIADSMLAGFYSGTGQQIGVTIGGFAVIPFSSGNGGLIMQDSNAVYWLLTIGTDGRLSTQQVSFP